MVSSRNLSCSDSTFSCRPSMGNRVNCKKEFKFDFL